MTEYKWRALSPAASYRLETILSEWSRTPYMAGQRVKGVGADCREFVVGVLDELYRRKKPTPLTRLGPDSAHHGNEVADKAVREMIRAFPSTVIRGHTVEPGDILVSSGFAEYAPDRQKHVLIAGSGPGSLWHCNDINRFSGVAKVPFSMAGRIIRIYRPKDKGKWA